MDARRQAALGAAILVAALGCGPRFSSQSDPGGRSAQATVEEPAGSPVASPSPPAPPVGGSHAIKPAPIRGRPVYDPDIDRRNAEAVKAHTAECTRRLEQASNRREGDEAWRWCEENQPAVQQNPMAAGMDRLEWSEAISWWPYRPALRASSLPRPGGEEVVSVSSVHFEGDKGESRGRRGDPNRDQSTLNLLYQYPPAVVETHSGDGILEGGGLSVSVTFYPLGQQVLYDHDWWDRFVVVRGRTAGIVEFRRNTGSNVDLRMISWIDALTNGGRLMWIFSTNPYRYTERQAIDFVNRLDEVR